jgi:hypothetical protein
MKKKTEAKCNGATLIVGFHAASPPLIWRFDLERNHSFTLALQGEDGDWELGVTSPKGEFYPVVHFTAREDAEEAFAKVEKALSLRKAAGSLAARWLKILLGVIAVMAAIIFLSIYSVNHKMSIRSSAISSAAPVAATPQVEEGVPLSADDVLKPPR